MGSSARPRIRHGEGHVAVLRLEVLDLRQPIWRRVLVSMRASLLELHGIIQHSLGQDPTDEHHFEVDGVRYVDPGVADHPRRATDQTSIATLAPGPGTRILHLAATESEPWRHVVTVEQVGPRLVGQRVPLCLDGGGAAPPDDCDGPRRYTALLDALAAPFDPRAAELREWLPEHFDPAYVDLNAVNAQLGRLPKHRPAA
ncbi:MAG: plasmid pRiA4b ORF-3 family protein [Gemmatimonadetes bacterium]|nr:plasmid pRiA4b ORF-3 family protein [Gemmatimonadota bacterium]MCB9504552.1 plasmid pRiA4b ORF-3 family protein [Gemmatimonadales bacterium]MCA9761728.1 plasmid pRiA4b ORF-3 family protein [Gemmatimonadota bacterium]MCA9768668.1 plasmid pRiA4b ORF-3 family protein [Gemmatimonadota bacterium]MCB9518125.1 plasmid pRiA4b ORF-3 family protein [Gemmatimonadales bacterium]